MIPFFSLSTISLGPLTLHVWGIFLALGFLLGSFMACRVAKQRGDTPDIIIDLTLWLMVAGMVGGRLGHVLFYDPVYYMNHPAEILEIWRGGLSVYGGIILGAIVAVWRLRKANVDVWRYADLIAFGLPFGKVLGRLGCFLIHDHPGTATDFVLGVQYPDSVVRHDLGLYLAVNAFFLSMMFLWLSRKPRPVGTYLAIFSVWYGVARFFLDFLRVVDVRYFGLTPGQYFSMTLFGFGIWMLLWIKRQQKSATPVKMPLEP